MKCDYELTYFLNGNPGKLRVPALDVEDDTTDEDIKDQLKAVFRTALENPNHVLHDGINNLVRSGLVFQPVRIKNLSVDQLTSDKGILSEVNKTENDGNTKFSEIDAHIQTATHPYKDIMAHLLTDVQGEVPAIHLTAERMREGLPLSPSDSATGVYVLGANGVDSITLHTPLNNVDQLNANSKLAKVLTKQMFVYNTNRQLEKWYQRDTKDFKEYFDKIKEYYSKEEEPNLETEIRSLYSSDPLNYMKHIFTAIATDEEFAGLSSDINKSNKGGDVASQILEQAVFMNGLESHSDQNSLNEMIQSFEDISAVTPLDAHNADIRVKEAAAKLSSETTSADEDLPFSKDFTSDDARDFKKSERSSKELLRGLSDNLEQMYNIKFNTWSAEEIANEFDLDPNATLLYSEQRAFVKDGQIYLNTDKASLAEPVHELGHIVLQGLKASDIDLYNAIISKFSAHPNYEQIAKYYPNLSADATTEEVFVTTLGEMFNGRIANKMNKNWETQNKGFLTRIYDSIKNFFSELFGIDSKRFYDLTPYELMNLSFEDIHSNFGNTLVKGEFTPITEYARLSNELSNAGMFLKGEDGDFSSLYSNFDALGFSDEMATSLWLKTKTDNFGKWAGDTVMKDSRGEPALFARTKQNNVFTLATADNDHSNLVYLKNALETSSGHYQILSPSQSRSIHNAGYDTKPKMPDINFVQKFAMDNGLKLQGSESSMDRVRTKLAEQYPAHEFEVKTSVTGDSYISFYPALDPDVKALRELLMKNNNINKLC